LAICLKIWKQQRQLDLLDENVLGRTFRIDSYRFERQRTLLQMAFTDRTFWVYPWDISDRNSCDRLADIRQLGANAISIPFSYHSLRALAPHHDGSKVFNTTAAICFRPREGEFSSPGIKPFCAEWAAEDGPVSNLHSVAEREGLRIRAWTVVFHNTPLATAHPDSAIRNCFGDVFAHALCPSAPKSREYAFRLVQAISRRPIHAIELEAAGFYGYEHQSHHDKCGIVFDLFHHFLFSCCFCVHCRKSFSSSGVDPDFISARFCERLLRFFNDAAPRLNEAAKAAAGLRELIGGSVATSLLRARNRCVFSLLKEIRNIVPTSIELTVTSGLSPFECSALFGAYPRDTGQIADRLLLVVFEPDEATFRRRFDDALQCQADASRWIAGIRIFPPDAGSRERVESRLDFLKSKGFRAIHLYHYGLAPNHLLSAAATAWRKGE
jgi:hypothetical protein